METKLFFSLFFSPLQVVCLPYEEFISYATHKASVAKRESGGDEERGTKERKVALAHEIRRVLGDAVKGHNTLCEKVLSRFCINPFKILKFKIVHNME